MWRQLDWQTPGKSLYADAIDAAKKSDVAIVCVSTLRMEGEGNDRPSMDLPGNQAALIRAIAAVNKNTIVVLNNGTPVTMKDWLRRRAGSRRRLVSRTGRRNRACGHFVRRRESVRQTS